CSGEDTLSESDIGSAAGERIPGNPPERFYLPPVTGLFTLHLPTAYLSTLFPGEYLYAPVEICCSLHPSRKGGLLSSYRRGFGRSQPHEFSCRGELYGWNISSSRGRGRLRPKRRPGSRRGQQ